MLHARIALITACFVFVLVSTSWAQTYSGQTFDSKTGNQYKWQKDSFGKTTIHGNNPYTGNTWKNTIKPDGSQSGTDSKGNHWQYNNKSGNYHNFGTGKSCWGKGQFRICN